MVEIKEFTCPKCGKQKIVNSYGFGFLWTCCGEFYCNPKETWR
jgi:predicted RNA-binding Zn-ribbon protein involved in translation (DUF1610 family)